MRRLKAPRVDERGGPGSSGFDFCVGGRPLSATEKLTSALELGGRDASLAMQKHAGLTL